MRHGRLEKEVVDEIIFRTVKPRNRLLLEPTAPKDVPDAVDNFMANLSINWIWWVRGLYRSEAYDIIEESTINSSDS